MGTVNHSKATLSTTSENTFAAQEQAAELVITARLGGQLPINDKDLIIQAAEVWSQVLQHAKIPLTDWQDCLIEAMSRHDGKFPLQVGALVAAQEAVRMSRVDNRTLEDKMNSFNARRAKGVESYQSHLALAEHLRTMSRLFFADTAIQQFIRKYIGLRELYFSESLLREMAPNFGKWELFDNILEVTLVD